MILFWKSIFASTFILLKDQSQRQYTQIRTTLMQCIERFVKKQIDNICLELASRYYLGDLINTFKASSAVVLLLLDIK